MIRKRTIIIVITILLLLAGILFYLQWGRQMDVSSSSGFGSDNHYELRVSVILNTLVVTLDIGHIIKDILQLNIQYMIHEDFGH